MSIATTVNHMSRRTKRIGAAGLAVLITLAAGWFVSRAVAFDEPAPRGQARPAGMEDMAGMNMDAAAGVRLTPEQIRTFGITFGTVDQRVLQDEVRTVGIVTVDETRLASVTPRFSGYVERLYVDFTGQPVRRGQPLVDVYSPELVAAQEELLLAARLERDLPESTVPGVPGGSSNLVAAAVQRLRLWGISETQIEAILESGQATRTLTLHAPASGIVMQKNVLAGQAISAGQSLYTIADLTEVWIEAELREADAGLVETGDAATVELAAFPGRLLTGRIEYVYPVLQAEARTLKARIAVPNADGRLKPGMYATVRLSAPGHTAVTVPSSAILDTGERRIVFVDMGSGHIIPQEVEIGRIAGDYGEVLAGLEPGQRVVTSAQFLLDSESNLAEVMRSMIGMMNTSDLGSMDTSTDSAGAQPMDMPRGEH